MNPSSRRGAIQSGTTWLVELLWGVLPIGDAQLCYIFRWQADAMGQTQIQDTGAAKAVQCAMAHQDEEQLSSDVFLLERYQISGWIMGAVRSEEHTSEL